MAEALPTQDLYEQLYDEAEVMAQYAFTSGFDIPKSLMKQLEDMNWAQPKSTDAPDGSNAQPTLSPDRLMRIHQGLARVVAPATPRSISALNTGKKSVLRFLGPLPLIRQMMLLALFSLTTFVCLSLLKEVNPTQINKSLLNNNGLNLFYNEMFLLAAAALGASFYNLFEANKYYKTGTFDPIYNSSYWVRFILGVIAGLILGEVIYSQFIQAGDLSLLGGSAPDPDTAAAAVKTVTETAGTAGTDAAGAATAAANTAGADHSQQAEDAQELADSAMLKPILAMLGGFSSDLVFRILRRMVTGVETVLRGDPRDSVQAQQQSARDEAKMNADREKISLAGNLANLKSKLSDGADPKALSDELQGIVDQMTQTTK